MPLSVLNRMRGKILKFIPICEINIVEQILRVKFFIVDSLIAEIFFFVNYCEIEKFTDTETSTYVDDSMPFRFWTIASGLKRTTNELSKLMCFQLFHLAFSNAKSKKYSTFMQVLSSQYGRSFI